MWRSLAGVVLALALGTPMGTVFAQQPSRTLLVLGDSLSAEYGIGRGTGWVSLLSKRIDADNRPYAVVNASISGETTSGGLNRLPDLLARHSPAVVLLELGGNDALRGLPIATVESNLRQMVRLSKAAGARVVVAGMMMPPNYGRAYAEQFAAVYRRVADSEKAALVPFLLEGIGERPEYFLPDRIHPNATAQPLILENVWPVLSKVL
jgi:acyl-CoA thioesterase I